MDNSSNDSNIYILHKANDNVVRSKPILEIDHVTTQWITYMQ